MKRYLPSALIKGLSLGCLLLLNVECGVTVGNSGPPSVANTDDELTELVGIHIDETLGSSNDQSSSDAVADAALVDRALLADDFLTCTEDAAARTATLAGQVTVSTQVEWGKAEARRVIADQSKKEFSIVLGQTSGLEAITCNDKSRPVLSWLQLGRLQTSDTITKTRTRAVTLKADGASLRSSTLTAKTQRDSTFSRDLLSLTSITYSKSTSFDTRVSWEVTAGTQSSSHENSVATVEGDPIVLQRTLKRGSGLTEAKIVSGSTQTTKTDGKVLMLHYKDLQLSIGDSCLPASGSITGEIYANANATVAERSLVVTFSEIGVVLSVDGGEETEIDLETCKL